MADFLECVGLRARLIQAFSLLADFVDNVTHWFVAALLFVCLCPHGLHESAVHAMRKAPVCTSLYSLLSIYLCIRMCIGIDYIYIHVQAYIKFISIDTHINIYMYTSYWKL